MGDLDHLVLTGGVHAACVEVPTAVLRAEIAQGHHPQQLAPRRVRTPGRAGRRPPGDNGEGSDRQPREQSGAQPVIQRRQPLVRVEQDHQPATVERPGDGTIASGRLLPQRLEHGRRRRQEVAPVQTDHPCARVGGEPGVDVQQGRLADARGSVEVEQQERRVR